MRNGFPRLLQVTDSPHDPIWERQLDLSDPSMARAIFVFLEQSQERAQVASLETLSAVSQAAFEDILALKSVCRPLLEHALLDFMQFWLAIHPLRLAVIRKQMSVAHDWLIQSLCDVVARVVTHAEWRLWRLSSFLRTPHPDIRLVAEDSVIEWVGAYCYYSRVRGVLHEVGREVLPHLIPAFLARISVPGVMRALSMALSWAEKYEPSLAKPIALGLDAAIARPHVSREEAKQAAIALLVSREAEVLGTPKPQRAAAIRNRFGDLLMAHEPLQLLATEIGHDAAAIAAARTEVLSAIDTYQAFVARVGARLSPWSTMYERARLFELLGPVFQPLIVTGNCSLGYELLARWLGVNQPRPSTDLLHLVLYDKHGVSYAMGSAASTAAPAEEPYLSDLTQATNRFLGTSLVNISDAAFELENPDPHGRGVAGVVDQEQSHAFEARLKRHLDLPRLETFLGAQPRPPAAMVIVPGAQLPLQTLMLKQLGRTWPWVLSFQQPAPDRALRSVAVWCAGTNYSEAELDALRALFKARGVTVTAIGEVDATRERFKELYCSDEFDGLWISAHGEFPAHTPHEASLVLNHARDSLTLAELKALAVPRVGRRLLVLNVCDGATSASLGGLPEIGLAAATCTPHQAVVSHLWPVDSLVASTFSVVLACEATKTPAYFAAFEETVQVLLQGSGAVLDRMTNCLEGSASLLERFRNNKRDFLKIANWGSAAFFE